MSSVLEVSGLVARRGPRFTLGPIDFALEECECVAVLGANGAGKSTLLACLLGFEPFSGSVRWFGTLPPGKARARLGVVFQNPEDQLFFPSVAEDVAAGLLNRGMERRRVEVLARSAIEGVGLAEFAGEPAHRLSWGQRKRAAIACALAPAPDVLLLDEPTSELDGRSARELASVLNSLSVTKLFATHDLEFVRRTATRCLVLEAGKVVFDGPAGKALSDSGLLIRTGLV